MMAAVIKEQEMQKMAIQIIRGLLTVEQAMIQYNLTTEESVSTQVKIYKKISKNAGKQQSDFADMNVQAA